MTRPRKEQISIQDTPYYHIVSRCVRRTYLCGQDHATGKDYEHRRQWIENRIRILSSLFAVDICAYAVMSNHLHIVVRLHPEEIETFSDDAIIERWTSLFNGPLLVQKWQKGESLTTAEAQSVSDSIAVYRKRLASLNWFMKCLNEPIARQANKEDGCTGHYYKTRPCVLPFGPPLQAFKIVPYDFVGSKIQISTSVDGGGSAFLHGLCGSQPCSSRYGANARTVRPHQH